MQIQDHPNMKCEEGETTSSICLKKVKGSLLYGLIILRKSMIQQMGVSLNGGTPKTPQNDRV